MTKRASLKAKARALVATGAVFAVVVVGMLPAHAATPPPTVALDAAADGYINAAEAASVTASGTYDDAAVPAINRVQVRVNSSATCLLSASPSRTQDAGLAAGSFAAGPFGIGDFPEGTICVHARARADGVWSSWSTGPAAILDRIAPLDPTITSLPDPITSANADSVTIAGDAEADGIVSVSLTDGTDTVSGSATADLTGAYEVTLDASGLADGTLTATATLTDAAGNPAAGSASASALKDATAAAPEITSPVDGARVHGAMNFEVEGIADTDSVSVDVYNTLPATPELLASLTPDGDGAWGFTLRATRTSTMKLQAQAADALGNLSPLSAAVTITVDGTRPGVEIELPANNQVFLPGDPIVVSGTAADPDSGILGLEIVIYEIRPGNDSGNLTLSATERFVDFKDFTCEAGCPGNLEVSWSYAVDGLLPGYYSVRVHAIDAAGNRSAQPAATNFVATV